jgi:hypothetical protein
MCIGRNGFGVRETSRRNPRQPRRKKRSERERGYEAAGLAAIVRLLTLRNADWLVYALCSKAAMSPSFPEAADYHRRPAAASRSATAA